MKTSLASPFILYFSSVLYFSFNFSVFPEQVMPKETWKRSNHGKKWEEPEKDKRWAEKSAVVIASVISWINHTALGMSGDAHWERLLGRAVQRRSWKQCSLPSFCCAPWSKAWASFCIIWLWCGWSLFSVFLEDTSLWNSFIFRSSVLSDNFLGLSFYILGDNVFQLKNTATVLCRLWFYL